MSSSATRSCAAGLAGGRLDPLPARDGRHWPRYSVASDLWHPLFADDRRAVTIVAMTGGIILGVFAGYYRGWVDTVIMRIMDIVLAFPSILLALVLIAILGPASTAR
jgi:hypothetical protein